ncbi:MAG: hypothetical protein IJ526_03240 [Lachnospiraceae bacterium]|nr:hypothetical protein [Lachnospiraceae bacterium]
MDSESVIITGFGAIGKTTFAKKYPKDVIDMESGYYKWNNLGFENIPYEKLKGTSLREANPEWPANYHNAVAEMQGKYRYILTSMHWHLLEYLENEDIPYYLAYPSEDSGPILEQRCYERGNNKKFTDKMMVNFIEWRKIIPKYHPVNILEIKQYEFLENTVFREFGTL